MLKELDVGRRFQTKPSGPVFMRVELKHNLADVIPPGVEPGNGIPVINLNNGYVFWMKANTLPITP